MGGSAPSVVEAVTNITEADQVIKKWDDLRAKIFTNKEIKEFTQETAQFVADEHGAGKALKSDKSRIELLEELVKAADAYYTRTVHGGDVNVWETEANLGKVLMELRSKS